MLAGRMATFRSWALGAAILTLLYALYASADIREVDTATGSVDLNSDIEYLVDNEDLSLSQVRERGRWQENTEGSILNLGFTDVTAWVRVILQIRQPLDGQWYLSIPYPLLEEVDVYLFRDGQSVPFYQVSRQTIEKQRKQPRSYKIALPLPENLNGEVELVLRARSATSMQIPVELQREDQLLNHFAMESVYWGVYFGILCALVIYNLFLFFSLRDLAYIHYVLYLASISLLMLSLSGLGNAWLWAGEPLLTRYLVPVGTALVSFCALLFAHSFLEWREISPRWEISMKVAAGLAGVLLIVTWVDPLHGALFAGLLGSLVIVLLIAVGIAGLRAGVTIARYFVLAWTSFAAGTSIYLLSVFSIVPVGFVANHAMQVGSAAEVLLLSFALAHRIKDERARKLSAMRKQQLAERQVQDLEMQSLEQAMHDSITKLPNTSLLNQRLQNQLGKDDRLALVLVEYPQVREIASSMGHNLAEEMFCQLVRKLNHTLAGLSGPVCLEQRLPAYIAIPEFGSAVFVLNLSKLVGPLEPFVEQVVGYHEVALHSVRLPVFMNLHCGVAISPDHGNTTEILYQHASAAKDRSQTSKTPVQIYNEGISDFARRRLDLLTALPSAIDAGEIELYLQPQMNRTGQELVGFEVLLRWHSPQFGTVPPWEVIEIAENAGLMDMLSRYVVDQACKVMQTLRDRELDLTCSINLSVQNLTNSHFVPSALAGIREHGIPMDRIIFEVTETSMMHNMEAVIGSLLRIADSGCKIALDDFGTGYSSLAYLSRLPIHELKIDRCFISQMCSSRNDLGIVQSTLKLAESLSLETVAEGVEDRQTMEALNDLGCDRLQGYLFAKPMPLEAFCAWAQELSAN